MRPDMINVMEGFLLSLRQRSVCKRTAQACVIVTGDFGQVVSIGYNGVAAKESHDACTGESGNCGCVHAEMNALVKLKTEATSLMLLCTQSPCKLCARLIVNCKSIDCVIYLEQYRDTAGIHILRASDIACVSIKYYGEILR